MKKVVLSILISITISHLAIAQSSWLNTIRNEISAARSDTSLALAWADLSNYYKLNNPDSALFYGRKAIELSRTLNFPKGEVMAMLYLTVMQYGLGNFPKAIQVNYQASKIADRNKMKVEETQLIFQRGGLYNKTGEYAKALETLRKSKLAFDSLNYVEFSAFTQLTIAETYFALDKTDSAKYYSSEADSYVARIKDSWVIPYILRMKGEIDLKSGKADSALYYFRESSSKAFEDLDLTCACYLSMAKVFQKIEKIDSSILYANRSLDLAIKNGLNIDIINASLFLSEIYEKKNPQQALVFNKKALLYKDRLNTMAFRASQETFTDLREQERLMEVENARKEYQSRLRTAVFLAISFTLLIAALLLYRNSLLKQRAKRNIEKAYSELKATQQQLIQSEKMASLGQLTAGIAHEIQNPLNFVNNFSEVSRELIDELKIQKSDLNNEEQDEILKNIDANLEKISIHGKRAEAIVKAMLEHSRQSTGQPQPTDLNSLADEYLKLAYNGLLVKDKEFNVQMKTDFDSSIDKINIVPQDIARVLLNLYNNAFYAVTEKKKSSPDTYEPTVSVCTKKEGNKVVIAVTDNGNGIPQNIIDKVFQPFFTTKPTGKATGLGLSLSYDIIKAAKGEIFIKSEEGTYSEFTVVLPC